MLFTNEIDRLIHFGVVSFWPGCKAILAHGLKLSVCLSDDNILEFALQSSLAVFSGVFLLHVYMYMYIVVKQ